MEYHVIEHYETEDPSVDSSTLEMIYDSKIEAEDYVSWRDKHDQDVIDGKITLSIEEME